MIAVDAFCASLSAQPQQRDAEFAAVKGEAFTSEPQVVAGGDQIAGVDVLELQGPIAANVGRQGMNVGGEFGQVAEQRFINRRLEIFEFHRRGQPPSQKLTGPVGGCPAPPGNFLRCQFRAAACQSFIGDFPLTRQPLAV